MWVALVWWFYGAVVELYEKWWQSFVESNSDSGSKRYVSLIFLFKAQRLTF